MQRFTLIKQHPSVQLAHLYEHLFCDAAKSFLYRQGLFKYLDFSLYGTTYEQGGIIEIDAEGFTSNAQTSLQALTDLKILLEDEALHVAFRQIAAEEDYLLASRSHEAVKYELSLLNNIKWQYIDEFSILDTKSVRRSSQPLYLSNDRSRQPYRMTVKIVLESHASKKHRLLSPLFRQLVELTLPTIADQLSMQFGYYGEGDVFKDRTAKVDLLVYGEKKNIDLRECLDLIRYTIEFQIKKDAFSRLIEVLQSLSHTSNSPFVWNTADILKETGIMIGTRGWQRIATHENLALLWPHMSVEVQLGKQKLTANLPPLL